jgi:hypothetical protein
VDKSKDFMACSDDIFSWFDAFYEKDEKHTNLISINDIFCEFTLSNFYSNLSKNDKRTYTKKYFTEKIESNLFLRDFVKPRDSTFNGIKLKKPHIAYHKKRIEENEN